MSSSSNSRASSVDSLFEDTAGEYDYLVDTSATQSDGSSPTKIRSAGRGTTKKRKSAKRMNPWITPQQAAHAVRRVNAEGSVSFLLNCRPRFREYSDEQLLEIFTVHEQWKNRETSRSVKEDDILRRFYTVIERLRSCDLSRRQDLLDRFLDRERGLHSIADADDIVWWVKLDLLELLMRWRRGDLDPFLLRGIETRKSQSTGSVSRGEDRSYRFKRAANVQGHNGLQVGQWWPLRIAMLRDGAHGSSEAGIAGNESLGAVSCILGGGAIGATGRDYPDVDNGEKVLYCSTTNQSKTMTTNTKLMLRAYRNANPIRLFRGSRLNNRYAPEEGTRYDGLYKIQDYEELNRETKLYRFHMQRLPGQPPIRYQGLQQRPSRLELMQWKLCLATQSRAVLIQRDPV